MFEFLLTLIQNNKEQLHVETNCSVLKKTPMIIITSLIARILVIIYPYTPTPTPTLQKKLRPALKSKHLLKMDWLSTVVLSHFCFINDVWRNVLNSKLFLFYFWEFTLLEFRK